MEVSTKEATAGLDIAVDRIDRIPTVEVDNYRGLNAQIILVTLVCYEVSSQLKQVLTTQALNFLAFAQLSLLVGSGSVCDHDLSFVLAGQLIRSGAYSLLDILPPSLVAPKKQAGLLKSSESQLAHLARPPLKPPITGVESGSSSGVPFSDSSEP